MKAAITDSVAAALAALGFPDPGEINLQRPARPDHGDWSSNVALALARPAARPPRELAADITTQISLPPHVARVEVAGPGFLNFRLAPSWKGPLAAAAHDSVYGRHSFGAGRKVNVEFVSANPTGPLHVGNGRWAAYGDALCRLLEATGHEIVREFYVNDTGGQIRRLGESVLARRRGEEVPDQGYQGDYVAELAKRYDGPEDRDAAGRWAAERILDNIRATCEAIGVRFDVWSSQAHFEEGEKVHAVIAGLRQRGVVYDADGAQWLRTTDFGDSRDRVVRRSQGQEGEGREYTYLAGDLAYLEDKLEVRGFDHAIYIWGADHHGQVASLLAAAEALGYRRDRVEIILGQLISLARGKLSKRAGNVVALHDVVEEIGPDAARFLFLISSIDTAMTLDLDVAVRQDLENPVYYVQMAHARVCSIAARAAERGVPLQTGDAGILEEPEANEIAHSIAAFPDVVAEATVERAPHKLATWCRKLAGEVHGYYHRYPVLPADPPLRHSRFALLDAARVVLGRGLDLLGVSAPTEMARLEAEEAEAT